MYIDNIEIANLGFIEKQKMYFYKDKINVIQGANGSGKTTILAAMYSMFQDDEVLKYTCHEGIASIKIYIENFDKKYSIEKHYQEGESQIIVNSYKDILGLSSIDRQKFFLLSGELLGDKLWLAEQRIKDAFNLLKSLDIQDNLLTKYYINDNNEYRFLSGGEQAYLRIISLLAVLPQHSILLCDEPFGFLDINTIKRILCIMRKMDYVQFILATSPHTVIDEPYNKIDLIREEAFDKPYPTFSYERMFCEDIKKRIFYYKAKLEEDSEKPIIKYRLNSQVEENESRNIEFKEIKGNNLCDSIIANAEIYIVAFLNSWVTDIGIIKWGISDNGYVKGVNLSKRNKDDINKKLSERLAKIQPYISADLFSISFEKIADENKIIPDLYIVEISIKPFRSSELFSTSKNEVYIKTEGGKIKLSSYEIQMELKRRLGD